MADIVNAAYFLLLLNFQIQILSGTQFSTKIPCGVGFRLVLQYSGVS
jgi:hypothetical protein